MAKSKARSLDEDKQILQKKVQEKVAASEKSDGDRSIRSLRKRIKRIQRKVRSAKVRETKANAKKNPKKAKASA